MTPYVDLDHWTTTLNIQQIFFNYSHHVRTLFCSQSDRLHYYFIIFFILLLLLLSSIIIINSTTTTNLLFVFLFYTVLLLLLFMTPDRRTTRRGPAQALYPQRLCPEP